MPYIESSMDDLKPYLTEVLIETGCWRGDGVQTALNLGYKRVFSIEVIESRYQDSMLRFANDSRVSIIFGDSRKVLPSLLGKFRDRVTLWLDAHIGVDDLPNSDIPQVLPVELEIIRTCGANDHNMVIDDMYGPPDSDPFRQRIRDIIMRINPNYNIVGVPCQGNPFYAWGCKIR